MPMGVPYFGQETAMAYYHGIATALGGHGIPIGLSQHGDGSAMKAHGGAVTVHYSP